MLLKEVGQEAGGCTVVVFHFGLQGKSWDQIEIYISHRTGTLAAAAAEGFRHFLGGDPLRGLPPPLVIRVPLLIAHSFAVLLPSPFFGRR